MTDAVRKFQIDRRRASLALLGALAFVAVGGWILTLDDATLEGPRGNPLTMRLAAIAAIVFFGAVAIRVLWLLAGRAEGLVVGPEGLDERMGIGSAGHIPWADIRGFRQRRVAGQGLLVVLLKDPQQFIRCAGSPVRLLRRVNQHLFGSPLVIATGPLGCTSTELMRLCRAVRKAAKKSSGAGPS